MEPDASRTVISKNTSPDISFDFSLNPYRGCEHGCSYCYARPSHEYLGYSAGLDFETRIVAKEQAPELLKEELSKKGWQPKFMVLSGVTDPYQPVERELQITRRCLKVLDDFKQPISIVTKNHLVTRDVDHLSRLASVGAAAVQMSVTSLSAELARELEPRASAPYRRLEAITRLRQAEVPVGVMIGPVIPGLNDHEVPAILQAAAEAGAQWARYIPLRLPLAVGPLFVAWLERHRPHARDKILRLVRELRGGKLNDSRFHHRFQGQGEVARRLEQLFKAGLRKSGLKTEAPVLSSRHFRVPGPQQMELF